MTPRELADSLRAELDEHLQAVRHIADMIEAVEPKIAPVLYHSQWASDAQRFSGDCGPACLAMLIEWRTGQPVSVDQLSVECNMTASRNTTTPADLLRVAQAHGLNLMQRTVAGVDAITFPSIALVHYEDLPRLDMKYLRGHWVVVLSVENGQVTYHDPDYWGADMNRGANRQVPLRIFDQAMYNCKKDGNSPGLTLGVAR